jgi:glycosyltransferase involved in cell wall biosynthesis
MKISIVTPSFNQAQFIERTLLSVLQQEGPLEYIVIDGGSSDGTLEILERYRRDYPNFSYVSEPDRGQSDAINKGLARLDGELMAYLNADDEYEPGAFAAVRKWFAENPDIRWGYGRYRIIDEDGREIRRFIRWYKHRVGRRYSYRKLLRLNIVPQPSVFWRRGIYEEFGGFAEEHHLVMDYEYWCRIGERHPGSWIPADVSRYRFYPSSKSGAQFARQYREEVNVARLYAAGRYPLAIALHRFNCLRTIILFRLLALFGK